MRGEREEREERRCSRLMAYFRIGSVVPILLAVSSAQYSPEGRSSVRLSGRTFGRLM